MLCHVRARQCGAVWQVSPEECDVAGECKDWCYNMKQTWEVQCDPETYYCCSGCAECAPPSPPAPPSPITTGYPMSKKAAVKHAKHFETKHARLGYQD